MNARRLLGVIDIGSNSGRCVVFQLSPGGHIHIVRDSRASLRLARALTGDGSLTPAALDRTLAALQDFRSIIDGADADWILAAATSAVREAGNADELIARAASHGVQLRIISGEQEAELAFMGAIYGLPITHGLVIDIGGGSMEVIHFRDRALQRTWTLPLGALRTSDDHLASDPPTKKELRRLRQHVARTLEEAGIPSLAADEVLVGTGGTIRNLAKVDRRHHAYPIPRLHGYEISSEALEAITEDLAGRTASRRARVSGLNPDRADSIVGGGLVISTVSAHVGAGQVNVAGLGLREGLALADNGVRELPNPAAVRLASINALGSRIHGWSPERAERTASIALALLDAVTPGFPDEIRESIREAAHLLEMGAAIDFYNRQEHAAQLAAGSDLLGFSHRGLALLAALIHLSEDERLHVASHRPLLTEEDRPLLVRAGVALEIGDELDARFPSSARFQPAWRKEGKKVYLLSPVPPAWAPRGAAQRFRQVFGLQLVTSN